MIKKVIQNDIFSTNTKHIVFAINSEGINDSGFAGMVAREYWHELKFCGFNEIGTVLSKKSGDTTFHALVTHSLHKDWGENQNVIIKECFDKIQSNGEEISSILIGSGFVGQLSGANVGEILLGMQESIQNISLYGTISLEEVNEAISRASIKTKKLLK